MHKVTNELKYNLETFSTSEINTPQNKPNFAVYDHSNDKWLDDVQLRDKYTIMIGALLNETSNSEGNVLLSKNTDYYIKRRNDVNIFKRIWSILNPFSDIDFWTKILISFICTCFFAIIAIIYFKLKQL